MSDGVEAKIMHVSGQSAIIMYDDPNAEISPLACVVDRADIGYALPGATVYISGEAIARSTAYGLDWSVFFPDGLTITAQDLQKVMCSRGILTLEDLKVRATEIPEIVTQLSINVAIQLYNLVKQELGG